MSEIVKRLRDRRMNVWEQAKELADRAADENRALSGEEEGQWQTLNAELDALDKRIKATLDGETRAKEAEEAFNKLEGRSPERPERRDGDRESELRAFLRGDRGRTFEVAPEGATSFRDLVKSTGSAGGHTVPTSFYDRLVAHLIETSAILQSGATILNTAGGETIQVPKTTAHSEAVIVAEANAITEDDPTFGQVPLNAYKYGVLLQVSRELLDDSGVDLEGYLSSQAGRALGNAFGAHAINGTGTNQPTGVITSATAGATGPAAMSGGFGDQSAVGQGADLLIELFHSVISPYRMSSSCRWIMNDTTAGIVRRIKTTEGQYIWQPSVIVGQPDTVLGKPVLIDPNVPDVGVGSSSVLFGDFSQYFVRLAGGVRFERSDDYAFNTDLVTFRALLRADGALVDLTGAVKYYEGGAAA